MDQKRLFVAIALSIAILLGFQLILPRPKTEPVTTTQTTPQQATPRPTSDPATPGFTPSAIDSPTAQRDVPRVPIHATRVEGSINLVGGRLDDLVLRDYHEQVEKTSPLVRLLEPRADPQPYYAQFGWTAETPGLRVPDSDTIWTATPGELTEKTPVTLSWDNGAGVVYEIEIGVDDYYLFTAHQRLRNNTDAPVAAHPWSRIRRDYKPVTSGYYILHEGPLGVLDGTLREQSYDKAKSESDKTKGASLEVQTKGGWAGITDKYWLTALIPDQAVPVVGSFLHRTENNSDRYQVAFVQPEATIVAPGTDAVTVARLFAGAKVVDLLDRYERELGLPNFDKAVDFGWFYYITKPIFYALDWLYRLTGNFGVAIMIFTVFAKAVFFPLASKSYRAMSKMKALGPKMTEIRERMKDDPQKMQSEIMGLYRAEKVNPASGCLPLVVQIPVFFSLYKVIFVTIEMRHAPFFGWVKDLSVVDPTNVFNLFGLIPFNPAVLTPYLHLGVWPLIMGVTMFLQQRLNPPPPDPVQAKIFQFMPIVFTFMMANFPAGLVIYWSWNNLLTIAQQWTIMRRTQTTTPVLVR